MFWFVSIASICVLCLNGASRLNEVDNPGFALALNPFNTEARTNALVTALNDPGTRDLDGLAQSAQAMIAAAPGDARGYSLLGAVRDRAGDQQAALALYSRALSQSKTELHALLRLAELGLKQSDLAGALDRIDLILRRWPYYWDRVQPILIAAATSPDSAGLVADKLNSLPPWRGRAISALSGAPATLSFARNLIAGAPALARAAAGWSRERDTVVSALAKAKAFGDAYGLFLTGLRQDEAQHVGYIFDSQFQLPPSGSYFGWRVQRNGATDLQLGPEGSSGERGLRVRFLDLPARAGIAAQNLLLPYGHYSIAVTAAAADLDAPKGLFWRLRCGEGTDLARIDIPEGSFADKSLQASFDVPATGCAVQTLSLDTEVVTDSWRDRYQGEARFAGIAITRP